MIKYIGFVIKPDIVEDVFIIVFDTDDVEKGSHNGKIAYRVRSHNITKSWVYYSYNSDTQQYIENDFYMEIYPHEIFDTFEKAQGDIIRAVFDG